MERSFIDRIFPPASRPILPQYHDQQQRPNSVKNTSPSRTLHGVSSSGSIASSRASRSNTINQARSHRTEPLSASLIHHDDPFLPIERAAKALQETIQSLLDVQSHKLAMQLGNINPDGSQSNGSITPTQIVVAQQVPPSGLRTIPVRQPVKKKITLKGARKGLGKSIKDFALLRQEEIRLLDIEATVREKATLHINDMRDRREALHTEVQSIKTADPSQAVESLKSEAHSVQNEIYELEHRILELKVRHRHLVNQATQIESSLESKASSYENSLSNVEKEIKSFLRRLPVHQPLGGASIASDSGMYVLSPERRTLEMAYDQWSSELSLINERKLELESERKALLDGGQMWTNAMARITEFENALKSETKQLAQSQLPELTETFESSSGAMPQQDLDLSMQHVLTDLDSIIHFLEADIEKAETNNWNLLIAALGAELDAFRQARSMLDQTRETGTKGTALATEAHRMTEVSIPNDANVTLLDTIVDQQYEKSPTGSEASNQSLQDTMREFAGPAQHPTINYGMHSKNHRGSESEDDEPPTDFLVSQ